MVDDWDLFQELNMNHLMHVHNDHKEISMKKGVNLSHIKGPPFSHLEDLFILIRSFFGLKRLSFITYIHPFAKNIQ